jgi:hypothetical protein
MSGRQGILNFEHLDLKEAIFESLSIGLDDVHDRVEVVFDSVWSAVGLVVLPRVVGHVINLGGRTDWLTLWFSACASVLGQ